MDTRQTRRLNVIASHIGNASSPALQPHTVNASAKSDNDVVIVGALRTAICKAKRGAFKDTHWTDLLAAALKGVAERAGVPTKDVEDVYVGTVLPPGGGAVEATGYPDTVSLATTNRQCSSGLQAVANIAAAIQSGYIKIGVAAGVESMSTFGFDAGVGKLNGNLMANKQAADCLIPMGITSENVAAQNGITRQYQDEFAAKSQQKAAKAQTEGLFKDEIMPVTVTIKKEDGTTESIVVDKDEGIRATTAEALSKLRPAFKKDGSTTAGNSSQVSDGAAAVLLMTRGEAKKRGLKILGKFHSFAVVGVPPHIMGVGPAFAIPPAVEKAGLTLKDIDIFEINEAFASQATYSIDKLKIPYEKVNPKGGAIALGHPLGCTGARQVSTLLYELHRTKQRYGVTSMCIGTGMGAAAVFEAEF